MHIGLPLFVWFNRLTQMACFVAAAGLYFFVQGFRLFARQHSLRHIPESTVQNASPGLTAISGMATGPHTLPAPISGERCYLYRATVWQQTGSGRNAQWEKVAEETQHLPFFVGGSTGQLLVEPFEADLDLQQNFSEEYGLPSLAQNTPPRVSAFLARHGIVSDRPIRIEERSLRPNTPVFIAGTLMENPGIHMRPFSRGADDAPSDKLYRTTSANYSQPSSPEVIRLPSGPAPSCTTEMTQQGKIAAALNRAGITNPEAWAVAGVPFESAQSEGVAVEDRPQFTTEDTPESTADAGFNPAPPLVLMKGDDHATFVISCHGQPELVGSLSWKSIAMVVGGSALIVLGFYVLLLEQQLR